MREIKFRAWLKQDKKMIYSHNKEDSKLNAISVLGVFFHELPWQCDDYVMQSTGLKDRNGVDIYEGDIVARYVTNNYSGEQVESWRGEVVMEHGEWQALTTSLWRIQNNVIAIGNIYENPDILKEGA